VRSHSGTFTETQCRASTAGRATTELCSRLNPTRLAVCFVLTPTRSRHSPDWDDAPSMTEVYAGTKIHQSELIVSGPKGTVADGRRAASWRNVCGQMSLRHILPHSKKTTRRREVQGMGKTTEGETCAKGSVIQHQRKNRQDPRSSIPIQLRTGASVRVHNPSSALHTGQTPPRPNTMTAPSQPQEDRVEPPGALGSQQ